MTSISSTQPSQTYLALPAPGAIRGVRGVGSTSPEPDHTELPPVAPIKPVTREPQNTDTTQNNEGTGAGTAGGQRSATVQGQGQSQGQTESSSQDNRPRVAVGNQIGQASTGFVVQSLSQETLGAGLHIEPWQTALSSYRSAAALPGSTASRPSVTA